MRRDFLADVDPGNIWGCPHCHARLKPVDERALRCDSGDHRFPIVDGIPQLFHADERDGAMRNATDFARVWKAAGWTVPDDAVLLSLPDMASGPQRGKWRQKSIATDALRGLLSRQAPRRVADLGAGIGWLSERLRAWGYASYAIDPSVDEEVGLGRARSYPRLGFPFAVAAGTLTNLPFRDGVLDATVCNASLHYVSDVNPVLDEIRRVLRPSGIAYVLNSPVHDDAASAGRAQSDYRARLRSLGARGDWVSEYTHLVRDQFERALSRRFGSIQRVNPDYGFAFTVSRRLKSMLLRMELASFPMYAAEKAAEGGPEALTT